jgi:anti-sigma-K factor RskA
MTGCASCRELVAGYVLGALEAPEAEAVERHLESCPRCAREHAELATMPALLDLAGSADAEPEGAPPTLEDAILDRFARERRALPASHRRERRSWRLGVAVAGGVAATAAALALAGGLSSPRQDPGYGHVRMARGGATAWAELRAVREGTRVSLSVRGLPAGRGRVYELWCIPDRGRWISGGTFRVASGGRAEVKLTSAARPGDYEHMLVTPAADRGRTLLAGRVEY